MHRDGLPRARRISLPGRSGAIAAFEAGPEDREVDVVFSHANGFNAATYRTILAPAAASLRILAFDLRGHGDSALPTDGDLEPGWDVFREDLLAVLGRATDRPVVLAGHSMGATSSLLAAEKAPQRVKALVLCDPVILPLGLRDMPLRAAALRRRTGFPSREAAMASYRGRGAFATWTQAQLADYVAAGFHDEADGQVVLACAPAWEARNFAHAPLGLAPRLESLATPTVILRAERESACVLGPDEPLSVQVSMETLPGTTHFLPMERPDALVAALLAACA